MTIRFRRFAAVLLVGGLAIGTATPAMAEDADTEPDPRAEGADNLSVEELKARCQHAIDRRLDDLAAGQARLDGAETLTDAHENTLDGIIDSTESGLAQLSNDLTDTEDRAIIASLCAQIAPDYRVYLVVMPQSFITAGADRADAAAARGHALLTTFDDAAEAAIEAGADIDDAIALRDQAAAHLATAESSNTGVADAALGVTPASYNEGSGAVVLDTMRSTMQSVRDELTAAIEDGRAAAEALRDAIHDLEDSAV